MLSVEIAGNSNLRKSFTVVEKMTIWVNCESGLCTARNQKSAVNAFVPEVKEISYFNPNHNLFLNLAKMFFCLNLSRQ